MGAYPDVTLVDARDTAMAAREIFAKVATRSSHATAAPASAHRCRQDDHLRGCRGRLSRRPCRPVDKPSRAAAVGSRAYGVCHADHRPVSVRAIDTASVLKIIEPIWATKTETANRVAAASRRSSIGQKRAVTAMAKIRRAGPATCPNCFLPAARSARSSTCQRLLTPRSPPSCKAQCGRGHRRPGARACRAHRGSHRRDHRQPDDNRPPMRWEHVDFEAGIWTIPETKTGVAFRVPLARPGNRAASGCEGAASPCRSGLSGPRTGRSTIRRC